MFPRLSAWSVTFTSCITHPRLHDRRDGDVVVMCRPPGSSDKYFIGLRKSGSVDIWIDGSESTYRAYGSGVPSDSTKSCYYYMMKDSSGQFMEGDCSAAEYYICKITSGLLGNY